MLIDITDLPDSLREQLADLRGIVQSALDDFVSLHKELRARYSVRTEASIIHDYMVWYVKDAGFRWRLKKNLFLFRVGEEFAVKPKKLDQSLRARNIPTQLVLDFDRQRMNRLFDDMDLEHVYLGYQVDGIELVTSSIWLVCPNGRRIKWAAELPREAATTVQVAVPTIPTMPAEPRERRVRGKQVEADKEKKKSKAGE